MKSAALRVRVDPELHDEFLNSCKEIDMSASQVLRSFMRAFVEKQGTGSQKELFETIEQVVKNQ